jgi:hypothetical protein
MIRLYIHVYWTAPTLDGLTAFFGQKTATGEAFAGALGRRMGVENDFRREGPRPQSCHSSRKARRAAQFLHFSKRGCPPAGDSLTKAAQTGE